MHGVVARRDHGFRHSGKLVKVSVGLRARPNVVGQTGSSNCDGAQECEALRTRRGKGLLVDCSLKSAANRPKSAEAAGAANCL